MAVIKNVFYNSLLTSLDDNPMTCEELASETGHSLKRVRKAVSYLKSNNELRSVILHLRKNGHGKYTTEELIGNLADKTLAYREGNEFLLAKKMLENMPERMSHGFRSSATLKLKFLLPKEAFEIVWQGMRERKE